VGVCLLYTVGFPLSATAVTGRKARRGGALGGAGVGTVGISRAQAGLQDSFTWLVYANGDLGKRA
jgi:hypothetical protein